MFRKSGLWDQYNPAIDLFQYTWWNQVGSLIGQGNDATMCGVGFICHIKGHASHKIVSDARNILCNMTHRGASTSRSPLIDGNSADLQPAPMLETAMVRVS